MIFGSVRMPYKIPIQVLRHCQSIGPQFCSLIFVMWMSTLHKLNQININLQTILTVGTFSLPQTRPSENMGYLDGDFLK